MLVNPKNPIEFRVLIAPRYKEREKETVTLIALKTVNEFTSFHYEIVVSPDITDHTITLKILGLRAPQITLPGSGPAHFESEHKNLSGRYTVIVSKLDHQENNFSVMISDKQTVVEGSPENTFVEIVTNPDEW
jgi:hypothetical protein